MNVLWNIVEIVWLLLPFLVGGVLGALLLAAFQCAVAGAGDILRKDYRRGVRALGFEMLALIAAAPVTLLLYWLLLVIVAPQVGK